MKPVTTTTAALLLVLAAGAAFAGGEKCQAAQAAAKQAKSDYAKRCDANAEDCLSKMAVSIRNKGWLGIETQKTESGHYEIVAVSSHSPAQKAGFERGDILIAINGFDLYADDKTALKQAKKSLAVGSEVTYTVKRGRSKETLEATLAEVPQQVMAQWIGEHMLDQHSHIETAS